MNEIQIFERDGKRAVNARDLHLFLESKQEFATWIKNRIEKYDLVEDEDYSTFDNFIKREGSNLGSKLIEYALSIDAAKELSMVEGNEKGKRARKYFIECEKTAKSISVSSYQIEDPIKRAERWIEEQKEHRLAIEQKQVRIEEMQPKEEFFDAVTDSKDACDMGTVAKVLNCGIGRNKLFEVLREEKVLMNNNRPYQKYIDSSYFRVIEQRFMKNGEECINFKTIVYQSGISFIRKILKRRNIG